jgi:hypothetical protein
VRGGINYFCALPKAKGIQARIRIWRTKRHNPKIPSKGSQTTKTSCDHRWKPLSKLVWTKGNLKKVYNAAISVLNYPSTSVILFSYHNSYSKCKNPSWFSQGILLLSVLGASVPFYCLSYFLWNRCVLCFTKKKLLVWDNLRLQVWN